MLREGIVRASSAYPERRKPSKEEIMKLSALILGLMIGAASVQAAPAKTPVEKAPKAPKISAAMLEDFEREALTGWICNTREFKDQPDGTTALEQTMDDKITMLLTKDKKLALKGKGSLQVVYEPATANPKKEAIVVLRDSSVLMGDRDALRLQVVAMEGKGTVTVQLIDVNNTVRYTSQQPIEATFRKMKTLTLDRVHFGIPEKVSDEFWKNIKRVQFVLHGGTTLLLDQLEFVPLSKK
jgi:hypothetical protein